MQSYQRKQVGTLLTRLLEPRRLIHVVAGPRQVGKTTLVQQATEASGLATHYASADVPALRAGAWIEQQWEAARELSRSGPAVLVLDEIQKIPDWSEQVKRLWDEDTRRKVRLHVVVLGSAPWLVHKGLTESLAGRFEKIHVPHWSAGEMGAAFDWSLDQSIFYGGYPGTAPLIQDHDRWSAYVRDSLIETSVSRDVLLMERIDKPALLRRVFALACEYSGRILSYNKMLGQLQDAGNTTTLAHYLDLLNGAGLVAGIPKYAGEAVRRRRSSPKLQVYNTALVSAQAGVSLADARSDAERWGRLTESFVGAYLINGSAAGGVRVVLLAGSQPRGGFCSAEGPEAGRYRGQVRAYRRGSVRNGGFC